jgi:hypothetical protein
MTASAGKRRGAELRGAIVAALLAIAVVGVTPAHAAPTRAEYIAQVDPICHSFVGPMGGAWGSFRRAFKRMDRLAKSGTVKAWLKQTRRTAASLTQLSQIRTSMTDQIAVLVPPAADSGTVGLWLGYLRNEGAFESSAASALLALSIDKFFKRLGQADKAWLQGKETATGFGFHTCGTFPVV